MHFHLGLGESVKGKNTETETLLKRQVLWLQSVNFVKLRSEGASKTEGLVTAPRKGSGSLKRGLNSKEVLKQGSQTPARATLLRSHRPLSDAHAGTPPRCSLGAGSFSALGLRELCSFLGCPNLCGINWNEGAQAGICGGPGFLYTAPPTWEKPLWGQGSQGGLQAARQRQGCVFSKHLGLRPKAQRSRLSHVVGSTMAGEAPPRLASGPREPSRLGKGPVPGLGPAPVGLSPSSWVPLCRAGGYSHSVHQSPSSPGDPS